MSGQAYFLNYKITEYTNLNTPKRNSKYNYEKRHSIL